MYLPLRLFLRNLTQNAFVIWMGGQNREISFLNIGIHVFKVPEKHPAVSFSHCAGFRENRILCKSSTS